MEKIMENKSKMNEPPLYKHNMIGPWSWNKEIDFCRCISFYIYKFYNIYFIFSSFLYLRYFQFSLLQLHVEFQKNPMSCFREKVFTWGHTDILTYWQWWFHRIRFRLKAKKSTLELQQFLRYISFKNLFGYASTRLTMSI